MSDGSTMVSALSRKRLTPRIVSANSGGVFTSQRTSSPVPSSSRDADRAALRSGKTSPITNPMMARP